MFEEKMYKIVLVTCPTPNEGESIAHSLLKKRLAACVSILPDVVSVYWWKGKIEKGSEVLLVVKTTSEVVDKTIREIRSRHSYENPEIIALDVSTGSRDYLKWISGEVKSVCRSSP